MPITTITPFYILQQVYDFITELPNYSKKPQSEKVINFFESLHEGNLNEFSFVAPETILGNFGGRKIIKISRTPTFADKNNFIKWVHNEINK